MLHATNRDGDLKNKVGDGGGGRGGGRGLRGAAGEEADWMVWVGTVEGPE